MNQSTIFICACGLAVIAKAIPVTGTGTSVNMIIEVHCEALLTVDQAVKAALECGEYADGS